MVFVDLRKSDSRNLRISQEAFLIVYQLSGVQMRSPPLVIVKSSPSPSFSLYPSRDPRNIKHTFRVPSEVKVACTEHR